VGSALAGAYGHLTLNANGSYSYIADNTAAVNSAPTGSHLQDAFSYTVSDGNGGTTTASLAVTLDRAPVVTASNVTLSTGHTTVAASSLFSATDPDGNTITTYAFEDTGSGHFVLNGVGEPNNQEIDVSAAQLSQLTYQGVAGSTVDTVEVRVNDGTLWSSWTSFTVTPPTLVIQTDGNTSLVEVGNIFDVYVNGSGPSIKYGGAAVTVGEFGTWTPIGAIQTASGYDVAWHDPSSGQYEVWALDSNGNFLSTPVGLVQGNNTALESIETTFNQDLNGDHTIGPPPATQPAAAQVADKGGESTGADLQFAPDNFNFVGLGSSSASPGSQTGTPPQTGAVAIAGHDLFVFAPSSGQVSIENFSPSTDIIQFSKTAFVNIQALLARTHDNASGNAVITDAAHDTITVKQVTTAQLLAHQSDFHFI